jgi:hypothetical protein
MKSPMSGARRIFQEMEGEPRSELVSVVADYLHKCHGMRANQKNLQDLWTARLVANTYCQHLTRESLR